MRQLGLQDRRINRAMLPYSLGGGIWVIGLEERTEIDRGVAGRNQKKESRHVEKWLNCEEAIRNNG